MSSPLRWLTLVEATTRYGILAAVVACSGGGDNSGAPPDSGPMSDAAQRDAEPGQVDSGGATDAGTSEGSIESGSCSDGSAGGDGGCTAYQSCADLTNPVVSFASDILPLFEMSCGIAGSACHGSPSTPKSTGQVYLGSTGASAQQVLSGIVAQSSAEDPQMQEVAVGKPGNSWLMHKLDGDQCLFESACNATGNVAFQNCGVLQPYGGTPLDEATRDTIRRWIAQGALNN